MGKYYSDRKFLYADNGYFNASSVIDDTAHPFILVTGARGTGKTYSTFLELIKRREPFILLRRTQDESDLQANENTSSLTKVLRALNVNYTFGKLSKKVGVVYVDEKPLIYTCGLKTFASIRGVDFGLVKYAVYDEFIPETHVMKFRAEGMALLNFYESVNRNRELEGYTALKLIGLSNSMNIANDIFMELNLVTPCEHLSTGTNEIYTDGGIMLIMMKDSPISKKKAETSLYENASEQFSKMAIENKFILNDFTYIQKRNLKEFKAILKVGDIYLYQHKSSKEYYVTFVASSTKKIYTNSNADLERFRKVEWKYYKKYLLGKVSFDSYKAIALLEKYYKG